MRLRALLKIAVLGGFLVSAFNYCPPGVQPAESRAMNCCHRQSRNHSPSKSERKVSCCTQERLAASGTQVVQTTPALALYTIPQNVSLPQVVAQRLTRILIGPAGPPGDVVAPSTANRAPPLA